MVDDFALATTGGPNSILQFTYQMTVAENPQARLGDFAGAEALVAATAPYRQKLRDAGPTAQFAAVLADQLADLAQADIALQRDDLAAAQRDATEAVKNVQALKPEKGFQEIQYFVTLYSAADIAARAQYLLGDYVAAAQSAQVAVESRKKYLTDSVGDRRDVSIKSTWLAMALARQGRAGEALQVIGPVVKFEREIAAKNHGDQWVPIELAGALYAEALADKKHSGALLQEAAKLLDSPATEVRATHEVRQWRERVQQGLSGPTL
jgi:hypothetical protein